MSDQILHENEGIKVLRKQTCILCGSQGEDFYQDLRDRIAFAPGTWGYKRCPKDGLVWLDPQPVSDDIIKLYQGYKLTHSIIRTSLPKFTNFRRAIREAILSTAFGYKDLTKNTIIKIIGKICSLISPLRDAAGGMVLWLDGSSKGRLLDVGCGNGEIISYLRDLGWEVTGMEPDATAANLARERYGLDVFTGSIEQAQFPADSFDAITMTHVIEHLSDPILTLKECNRVLKPWGRLIIITPNIKSLGQRVFGSEWLYLDPPRHLNIFSNLTLQACSEKAEFLGAHIRSIARNGNSVWNGSRRIQRNGKITGNHLLDMNDFGVNFTGFPFLTFEYLSSLFMSSGEELILMANKS